MHKMQSKKIKKKYLLLDKLFKLKIFPGFSLIYFKNLASNGLLHSNLIHHFNVYMAALFLHDIFTSIVNQILKNN